MNVSQQRIFLHKYTSLNNAVGSSLHLPLTVKQQTTSTLKVSLYMHVQHEAKVSLKTFSIAQ